MQRFFAPSARTPSRAERRGAVILVPAAMLAAALSGILAGAQPVALLVPSLLVAAAIVWKRPYYAVVFLVLTATTVEEFSYDINNRFGVFTSSIPWWRTFTHGMTLFPVEIFLLVVVLIWLTKGAMEGTLNLPKSPVKTCLKLFWVLLIIAVGIGMAHGAQLKYNLWELRSWIYFTVAYLLAASLFRTRQAIELLLWTLILGTGFKGIQGTVVFLLYTRHMRPEPQAILGHEEALLMGIFIMITVALWLWNIRGRLRTTATCLLPFVFIADLANTRRTAWLILALCFLTLFAIALATLPDRRRFLLRTLVVVLIGMAVYLPAYWKHSGTLAGPAEAVRAEVQPNSDARDKSSDLYRDEENANLIFNIKGHGLLGAGFGVPIDYAISIANISSIDPMIAYIPHNGLLWVWLRTGAQGEIVFWCIVAAGIVRACELAKSTDRWLAMIGAVTACALVGYVVDGYEDMAFAEYRIAVVIGVLMGVTEVARRFAKAHELATQSTTEVISESAGLTT
jgi:O-Antigen ligase